MHLMRYDLWLSLRGQIVKHEGLIKNVIFSNTVLCCVYLDILLQTSGGEVSMGQPRWRLFSTSYFCCETLFCQSGWIEALV